MLLGYRIRLLPTKEQEELMWKHVGAARFVFNWGLDNRKKAYENEGLNKNWVELSRELTQFKKTEEGKWLKGVNCQTCVRALKDLENAYTNFFRNKRGFPKFKSRHKVKPSFSFAGDKTYFKNNDTIVVPTIGHVKVQHNYNLPIGNQRLKAVNPRVSFNGKKWVITFSVETPDQVYKLNDFSVGVDLGVKTLMTVATSDKSTTFSINNVNKSSKMRKLERQKKRCQRKMAKSKKQSKRREKVRVKLQHKYNRIRNIRQDFIHKATRKVADLLPKRLVIEDLNVKGMMSNHRLAKSVQDCCFGEIARQLEYKAKDRGIEVVCADRYFPSSKRCSNCQGHHKDLTLKDRTFDCPHCGHTLDRDLNAAINLAAYSGF